MLGGMEPGDVVSVPNPRAMSAPRRNATYVRRLPSIGPLTMDGYRETTAMHRVRYDDGIEKDLPDGSIWPIEGLPG
jgi:hypothetical protein